jgi:5-methylcytosine-specific restriction endonuclease McrA
MKKKTAPKPYNWDTKIIGSIRKVFRFSPERRAVLDAARVPNDRKMVRCAMCAVVVHEKLAAVDHIWPVIPVSGFVSWDDYIQRMKTNQMQVLCEPCHKEKTKAENAERATFKREAKKKAKKK